MARERLGVHRRNDVVVDIDAVRLCRPLGARWRRGKSRKARSNRAHAPGNEGSSADGVASRRRARLAAETPRKELTSTGGAHGSIPSGVLMLFILGTAPGAVKRALGRSTQTPPIRERAVWMAQSAALPAPRLINMRAIGATPRKSASGRHFPAASPSAKDFSTSHRQNLLDSGGTRLIWGPAAV